CSGASARKEKNFVQPSAARWCPNLVFLSREKSMRSRKSEIHRLIRALTPICFLKWLALWFIGSVCNFSFYCESVEARHFRPPTPLVAVANAAGSESGFVF